MAKQVAPQTTYAIKLATLTNSFYDADSKANLFKNTPYYFFNHKPTLAIINGVKNGRLIDLKNNILEDKAGTETGVSKEQVAQMQKAYEAKIEELTAEIERLKAGKEVAKTSKAKKAEKPADEE